MTDMSAEPTGWWQESMPDYSQPKMESAPSAASVHANGTLRSITITGQEPYEDYYATSATSASGHGSSIQMSPSEPVDTSPGLPLINLPDPEAWAEWLAEHQNP